MVLFSEDSLFVLYKPHHFMSISVDAFILYIASLVLLLLARRFSSARLARQLADVQ